VRNFHELDITYNALFMCAIGHIPPQEIPVAAKFAERRCPRSNDPLSDLYHAKALIPKGGYSQENIESLFRWYLRKHERDADMLKLEISIGVEHDAARRPETMKRKIVC
jgi:hypothetical protein